MEETKNTKKILACILIPLSIVLAFLGGFFSHYLFRSENVEKANEIIKIMERVGYVYDETTGEKRPITSEDVADALVRGLFDKHSAYYTEKEYEAVKQADKGNMTGVGLAFYDTDNVIDKVVFNSPADLSGLEDGDKIIECSCNENTVAIADEEDFSEFMATVKNGVNFTIKIERNSTPIPFTLKKQKYVLALVEYKDSQKSLVFRSEGNSLVAKAIDGGMALDDQTAYIEFTNFDEGAGEQMAKALQFMKERGRTKLILDLRNNSGGFLAELQHVASYLIYNGGQSKSFIVHAKTANKDQDYYTNFNGFNTNIAKICVLANENSASASECLIGAMLHYGDCFSKDTLIIEKNASGVAKTYGKGIMQTTYELVSGGALKLTTGKIFWPDKKTCIQDKGIYTTEQNSVEKGQAISRAIEVLN